MKKNILSISFVLFASLLLGACGSKPVVAPEKAKETVAKGTVTKGTVTKGTAAKGTVAKGTVVVETVVEEKEEEEGNTSTETQEAAVKKDGEQQREEVKAAAVEKAQEGEKGGEEKEEKSPVAVAVDATLDGDAVDSSSVAPSLTKTKVDVPDVTLGDTTSPNFAREHKLVSDLAFLSF